MENITVKIIEPKKTQTLMFENVAEVGDKIRAYDFLPRQDGIESFVEGEIINKGYLQSYYCYFIKVTKRIKSGFDATSEDKAELVYVPFETSHDYFEKKYFEKLGLQRVTKL